MTGDGKTSILERAFQIARAGTAVSVEDVRCELRRERYANVNQHTAGPLIRRQLLRAIEQRKAEAREYHIDAIAAQPSPPRSR